MTLSQVIRALAAEEIKTSLEQLGHTWEDFDLPAQLPLPHNILGNPLIQYELSYDSTTNQTLAQQVQTLNNDQQQVFNILIDCVQNPHPSNLFFLDGPGGTGKTYLYSTLSANLCINNCIVIELASSGIAANELIGGKTAHSLLKIPLELEPTSTCDINFNLQTADLIREAALIIWDEAPMCHRNVFEAVDRTLRDIMQCDNLMGGKVFLLGGDFRQILPVVVRASKPQMINATLKKSPLWKDVEQLQLTQNMRNPTESNFLLSIGNGTAGVSTNLPDERLVTFPRECCIENTTVDCLIDTVFTDFENNYQNTEYIKDRVILAPTNTTVDEINSKIIDKMAVEGRVYYSADSIELSDNVNLTLYPTEFLNSLNFNGVPLHRLSLKIGMPVILLRNLKGQKSLANGTRLIIRHMYDHIIDAEIAFGKFAQSHVFLPRITLCPAPTLHLPFSLKRRQFPVKPCFAMTINKSQGQTIKNVGLYGEVFTHGQLYLAASRVKELKNFKLRFFKLKQKIPSPSHAAPRTTRYIPSTRRHGLSTLTSGRQGRGREQSDPLLLVYNKILRPIEWCKQNRLNSNIDRATIKRNFQFVSNFAIEK